MDREMIKRIACILDIARSSLLGLDARLEEFDRRREGRWTMKVAQLLREAPVGSTDTKGVAIVPEDDALDHSIAMCITELAIRHPESDPTPSDMADDIDRKMTKAAL